MRLRCKRHATITKNDDITINYKNITMVSGFQISLAVQT